MEWVLSHMEDPDFNEPLPASSSSQVPAQQQSSQKAADPEQVAMLGAMGFTPEQVVPTFPMANLHHIQAFTAPSMCRSQLGSVVADGRTEYQTT